MMDCLQPAWLKMAVEIRLVYNITMIEINDKELSLHVAMWIKTEYLPLKFL